MHLQEKRTVDYGRDWRHEARSSELGVNSIQLNRVRVSISLDPA